MVIDDSDLGRTGFTPAEDDSPLVVDTYGVKASEFAFERLQSVARRNGEIIKRSGMIHLEKFSQRDTGNRGESTIGFHRACYALWRAFVGVKTGCRQGAESAASPRAVSDPQRCRQPGFNPTLRAGRILAFLCVTRSASVIYTQAPRSRLENRQNPLLQMPAKVHNRL
jgi:hypothetical protein